MHREQQEVSETVKRMIATHGVHVSIIDGVLLVVTENGVIFNGPVRKYLLFEIEGKPTPKNRRRLT